MIYYTKDLMGRGMTHSNTRKKLCLPTNILQACNSKLTAKEFTFFSYDIEELQKVHKLIEENNELCKELFIEYLENGEENIDRIRVLNYQIFVVSRAIFQTGCTYE